MLLAAITRRRPKSKCKSGRVAELLMLSIPVLQLKDQWKPNKRIVKRDKMRRWKYKLGKRELPLHVFLVKREGREREMKSLMEGGKCSHKTVELRGFSLQNE